MKDAGFARVEKSDAHLRAPCARSCSVALRAQRASVSLHAHTVPPPHAESIESAKVLSSMVPRGHSCISGGSTYRVSPVARAPASDQSASFLSTPARFTAM